jgi:hypothetical protein
MGMRRAPIILVFVFFFGSLSSWAAAINSAWQGLASGMELRFVTASKPSVVGDSRIAVLRIDPALWELEFAGVSRSREALGHTARQWCEKYRFTAAINAGMFQTDRTKNVGYLRFREHVNNGQVNSYQSVAAFDAQNPKKAGPFHIFDLDDQGVSIPAILKDYKSAVQNLRLIKRPGTNQWTQQSRKWSEAALGEDSSGRILFIFSRSPFTMHDLNEELLSAGIGLVAAQHLEGGPEAQLYFHVGKAEQEMFGSYESGFRENDSNGKAWEIPNVLGVRPREKPKPKKMH